MLTSILKRSQSISQQSPSASSPLLNPQKPTQKTSESSEQQKDQLSLEEYTKLEGLLQSREASLREHAKHEYQLKLFIEDLEEKNKMLEKNNAIILAQYKAEVTAVKRENEGLRKVNQKLQTQNLDLKNRLQQALSHHNTNHQTSQKPQSVLNTSLQPSHNRAKSQSVIKVIQSVDHKQSFRQSQPNFRLSPFNMSGKQSPILPSYESKHKIQSQSRQKLQVTIKSSRFMMQNAKSSYSGRNQKHISGQSHSSREESVGRERSIKKLVELKKMNEDHDDSIMNKKLPSQKGSSIIRKLPNSYISSSNNDHSNQKSSQAIVDIAQQRIIVRNPSKQLPDDMRRSIHSTNSRQLSGKQRKSKQAKRITNFNDHELIKLGHYGNAEKTNINIQRKTIQQRVKN